MDLSIVVPVYNSEECLPILLRQLEETLSAREEDYEIILVDDGSSDASWSEIKRLFPQHRNLRAVQLMNNSGQANATFCGLSRTRGQIVVTMDDDLQHPPDQLPIILNALHEDPEVDCVFGVYRKKQHAWYRNLGSSLLRAVNAHASGLPSGADYSSFRGMRSPLVKALLKHDTRNPSISSLVFGSTSRVKSVTVAHSERAAGESNYTLARQIRLAFDSIINVSMLPLRIVTALGFLSCGLGLFWALFVAVRYFLGRITVPGWTTVVILVSFSSGIVLLSLGIIGEYLVRVLREVRGSPRFSIREELSIERE
jgi:dolichol-phosphate mannosyltransferase/undecaprenyl-phosphate 4-deoxy-4-formamido-L-arabinose transferase